MGNKATSLRRRYTSWRQTNQRSQPTTIIPDQCPICRIDFDIGITWDEFNEHVDFCIQNYAELNFNKSSPPEKCANAFTSKVEYFHRELQGIRVPWIEGAVKLVVSRDDILGFTAPQIMSFSDTELHMELQVNFDGEIAQDAGGLSKEWLNLLIQQIFSEDSNLFIKTDTKKISYIFPITKSPPDLVFYELTGKVIAKALFDKIPIYCPLSQVLFKHITKKELSFDDLKHIDDEVNYI